MKASFESIAASGQRSFVVRQFEEDQFSAPYHFHPELELTFIVKGGGKRYVGSHMNEYAAGDLVLLGSNLPHCWKTTGAATVEKSLSVVIHFQKDFLGAGFFSVPEMKRIRHLLHNSRYGVCFTGPQLKAKQQMLQLLKEEEAGSRLLLLLGILHELSVTTDLVLLDKQSNHPAETINKKERIHAAMAYIVDNFQTAVSLDGAAAAANMTPAAFCKYFKKLSRKTFIATVNDYRVDFAMGQLVNTDKPIAQVGFDSGFNDISNFYKTFKQHTRSSPLGYRKKFRLPHK